MVGKASDEQTSPKSASAQRPPPCSADHGTQGLHTAAHSLSLGCWVWHTSEKALLSTSSFKECLHLATLGNVGVVPSRLEKAERVQTKREGRKAAQHLSYTVPRGICWCHCSCDRDPGHLGSRDDTEAQDKDRRPPPKRRPALPAQREGPAQSGQHVLGLAEHTRSGVCW